MLDIGSIGNVWDVGHQKNYSVNIYSGTASEISFDSINNLFHPTTIDGCYVHQGEGRCGGIKEFNKKNEKYEWNLNPHKNRIVRFNSDVIKLFSIFHDF